jgi:hypothetical protein
MHSVASYWRRAENCVAANLAACTSTAQKAHPASNNSKTALWQRLGVTLGVVTHGNYSKKCIYNVRIQHARDNCSKNVQTVA